MGRTERIGNESCLRLGRSNHEQRLRLPSWAGDLLGCCQCLRKETRVCLVDGNTPKRSCPLIHPCGVVLRIVKVNGDLEGFGEGPAGIVGPPGVGLAPAISHKAKTFGSASSIWRAAVIASAKIAACESACEAGGLPPTASADDTWDGRSVKRTTTVAIAGKSGTIKAPVHAIQPIVRRHHFPLPVPCPTCIMLCAA